MQTVLEYKRNTFKVAYEKYSFKLKEYGKEVILLETKEGSVITAHDAVKPLSEQFINLYEMSSFNSLLLSKYQSGKGKAEETKNFMPFFVFAYNLMPMLSAQDTQFTFLLQKQETLSQSVLRISEYFENENPFEEVRFNARKIEEKKLEGYINELAQKEAFLKLFKPDIKALSFKKKLLVDDFTKRYYEVNEYVEYKNYKIDLELESVGIKKLYNLFHAIKSLNKGMILIIDELDSHINDVYLIRLLDYISKYADGQLIFTTHNASPMELLKKKKYALDFLAISGSLSSWTQVGNYSPSNMYHSGMIKKLPFNVTAESFIGVFADDE